jgi:hypothetical protein
MELVVLFSKSGISICCYLYNTTTPQLSEREERLGSVCVW